MMSKPGVTTVGDVKDKLQTSRNIEKSSISLISGTQILADDDILQEDLKELKMIQPSLSI